VLHQFWVNVGSISGIGCRKRGEGVSGYLETMISKVLLPTFPKSTGQNGMHSNGNGSTNGSLDALFESQEKPVGLQNLGNTCYLNCILQAVASCPPFRSYLMKIKERQERQKFRPTSKPAFAPTLLQCIRGKSYAAVLWLCCEKT
jgi:hypothetical protein